MKRDTDLAIKFVALVASTTADKHKWSSDERKAFNAIRRKLNKV